VKNKYPIYVISYGRWHSRYTVKALDRCGADYSVVIEDSQYEEYAKVISPNRLLILPQSYKDNYDTCDDLGYTHTKGSGPARNFVWDHSTASGAKRHWLMDDNIENFHRLNHNMKPIANTTAVFRAAEDFVDRYTNVPVAGFNYYSMCKCTDPVPPYILNTKVYSCLLLENASGYKWRARYNEDVDLCLRVLKDGLCTIQFNAFLAGKVTTKRMKGGNTDELYKDGTLKKSEMIAALHPDVASVVWRFNRWHHHVDYKPFKKNRLIRDEAVPVVKGVNNYGMKLIEVETKKAPEGLSCATGKGSNQ
jgi:hypothetical protein